MIDRCLILFLLCGALLLVSLTAGGCQSTSKDLRVTAMSTSRTAALEAAQVVQVMRYAGFSDEQILESGTDVRNAISQAGGANIRIGDRTEALLAVEGQTLHVSSRSGGTQVISLQPATVHDGAMAENSGTHTVAP